MTTLKRKKLIFPKAKEKWNEFCREKSVKGGKEFTNFFYRYAFAHGFQGMQVDGYSARTLKSYNAIFKVQLAYSAYDSMIISGKHIKHKVRLRKSTYDYSLQNKRLANSLRLNKVLLDVLIRKTKPPLSNRIKKFSNMKNDDVLSIASAIRHLVSHGVITVTSVDLLLVKNWKQIEKLSLVIMDFVDGLFADYVRQVIEHEA